MCAGHNVYKFFQYRGSQAGFKNAWLREADSIVLQQACINLEKAFQNFLKNQTQARYARFKSKRGKQSSYDCVGVKAGEDWIKVPRPGPMKARIHRQLVGELKSITLTRTATGKYYATLLVETG
ncbi:hypothetical protein M8009_11445 [Halomonas sp. ATCH28]|uniref:Transposase n=1 Tax=Halomonas gemina TaxID=2945105 RepID=A0ABT0T209_9GAMM|nr:hypothetical protein [Halomonas gemina]MCL7940902.1 hypothetical protein [Halomonas gemina]